MEYFLLRVDGKWEEVDKYIYDNFKFVKNRDGSLRYSETRFTRDGLRVSIDGDISVWDIGMIARMVGAVIPTGGSPKGFAPMPEELLLLQRGNSTCYYEVATGERYKKCA